jgi:hypothetical protein
MVGTTSQWAASNDRLYEGSWAMEITTDGRRLFKVGKADPAHPGMALPWNNLPYFDETNISGLPQHLQQILADTATALQAAISQEASARTIAVNNEAYLRDTADLKEINSRTTADNLLRNDLNHIAAESTANRNAFVYLIQFISAKWGPLDVIYLVTESGKYLSTESGSRLVI